MKIFCIGLSRTGTLSLNDALHLLGYRTVHYPTRILGLRNGKLFLKPNALGNYDAFADTPAARFYKELDVLYPGSKFILTVRNVEEWLRSCEKFFNTAAANATIRQLRLDLYSTEFFDAGKFRAGYERHLKNVTEYFRDRPGDLCVLNVTEGEGWKKLCPFLGKKEPKSEFPRRHIVHWDSPAKRSLKAALAGLGLLWLVRKIVGTLRR